MRGYNVNQETLYTLFCWLLLATTILMTLLALRRIAITAIELSRFFGTIQGRRLHKIQDKYTEEMDRIGKEIEPLFELWWNDAGRKTAEASPRLYDSVGLPGDVSQLPKEVQAFAKVQALKKASSEALEFAVHLATTAGHNAYIRELRRVDNKTADELAAGYEEHIEEHRSGLAKLNIDVDDFERRFAAA